MERYNGLIHKYRDRLPVAAGSKIVSLNEGNTPLIELENLPRLIRKNVRFFGKFEGLNPTGSFKEDRKSTRLNSSHIQKSRMPSSA